MNYFLKKKKWLAWVIMLTFLFTSFMPSNIMAGNSVAEAADVDYTITVGESIGIDSKFPDTKNFNVGFWEESFKRSDCTWQSDDVGIATVNSSGKVATVKGVSEGTVTVTAKAKYTKEDRNDRYSTKTWTVKVTGNGGSSELSPQNVYVYVKVGGNTDGLTLNSQGWYTIGVIQADLPNAETEYNDKNYGSGSYEYGKPHIEKVAVKDNLGKD